MSGPKNIPLGIMQGRLLPRYKDMYQSFPGDRWKEEFQTAKTLGLDCIEFIFDHDEDYRLNPLMSEEGLEDIARVVEATGVRVLSVCADHFMKKHLHDDNATTRIKNVSVLLQLIENSAGFGISDLTLPFVDASSLKSDKDFENVEASLRECLPVAANRNISLNLETDLPPGRFNSLIETLDHPRIKVNYDTGNSASLGYRPAEELEAYGRHVSVLHIKDRMLGGGSVRLGTGDTDFEAVFTTLKRMEFSGIIIMQAARAECDDVEINIVKEQLAFIHNCLLKWWHP